MRIDDVRPERLGGSAPTPAPRRSVAGPSAAARGDSVVISDQARALAAQDPGAVSSGLSPERLAELRRWLAEGKHDDPAVVRRVAERLLAEGDLSEAASGEAGEA